MTVAVITVVRGRHDHLRRQRQGLSEQTRRPDLHVVVALGDPQIADIVGESPLATVLVELKLVDGAELPLAAARNRGAAEALHRAADTLVFLDVDCIPAPELLARYADVVAGPNPERSVFCGPVSYLAAPARDETDLRTLIEQAVPHPARPVPPVGQVWPASDRRLFWSLSFALSAAAWLRIGGFCQDYVGYGGEDTDFIEQAAARAVDLYWVGGADAHHQYHAVSSPPLEHVESIVRNAQLFRRRWGWSPMTGWLEQFQLLGLVRVDPKQGWVMAS